MYLDLQPGGVHLQPHPRICNHSRKFYQNMISFPNVLPQLIQFQLRYFFAFFKKSSKIKAFLAIFALKSAQAFSCRVSPAVLCQISRKNNRSSIRFFCFRRSLCGSPLIDKAQKAGTVKRGNGVVTFHYFQLFLCGQPLKAFTYLLHGAAGDMICPDCA